MRFDVRYSFGVLLRPGGCPVKSVIAALLLLPPLTFAKDTVSVKVIAVHSASREARDLRATSDRVMLSSNTPGRTVEVFNLDTIINGEHVLLACEDDKGCEAPATDAEYQAEIKRSKFVHLTFSLPVSHKQVARWYKIAGSW
jgi:hypothetical protein